MDSTIINLHATDLGYSRDNVISTAIVMGCNWALVRNSPELAFALRSRGINIIYRQAAIDDHATNYDPGWFVDELIKNCPPDSYIHAGNEIDDVTGVYEKWTLEFQKALRYRKRKGVILNKSTNKTEAEWRVHEGSIKNAVASGDLIGFHHYDDMLDASRAGAFGWQPLYKQHGGNWCATEFGYIYTIHDGGKGYRTRLSPEAHNAFYEQWSSFYQLLGVILFPFCYDEWPIGKSDGFGYVGDTDLIANFHRLNARYLVKGFPKVSNLPVNVLPPTGPGIKGKLTKLPGNWVNQRSQPSASGLDVGDIRLNDAVEFWPNAMSGEWVYVKKGTESVGWVSLQAGGVIFTADPVTPPPSPQPEVSKALFELEGALAANLVERTKIENAIAYLKGAMLPDSGGGF